MPNRKRAESGSQEGRITKGRLEELRQGDKIGLLFPYKSVGTGAFDGASHFSSEYSLDLKPNIGYKIVVKVKGEDSDKNPAKKTKKIELKPRALVSERFVITATLDRPLSRTPLKGGIPA